MSVFSLAPIEEDHEGVLVSAEALITSLLPEARKLLQNYRENGDFEASKKAERDFVTKADQEIEAMLIKGIRERFPDHQILAEETSSFVEAEKLHKGYWWILDPVDGTTNFSRGHHHVGISIALFHMGEAQLAWVDAPFLRQSFFARRGNGAYENGNRICVRPIVKLIDALLATGFPYERENTEALSSRLSKVLASAQDIRRNGAASLDCCWVASGRLDGYFEAVRPWDMAAGLLIAREAGVRFGQYGDAQLASTEMPLELRSENFLIAAPAIFDELQALLNEKECS